MELIAGFGGGLMMLGLLVVCFDAFTCWMMKRIFPDPDYWNEAAELQDSSGETQNSLRRRKRIYDDAVSHRFRKWGIAIFVIGGVLLAAGALRHYLR